MYHFIGIKGSGMSALACILKGLGYEVQGSDVTKYIFTQDALTEAGIPILPFDSANIRPDDVIIVGNHFPLTHEEVARAYEIGENVYRYHEFLGEFMKRYVTFGVSGTHGKTTTTGMLAHTLERVFPTGYLIGDGTGRMGVDSTHMVVESCEYKRHFLAYEPDYSIITNIDLDHTDYYHDIEDYQDAFVSFANQTKKMVVLFGDDANIRSISIQTPHLYYGLQEHNDVRAVNVEELASGMAFDVMYQGAFFGHFSLQLVGHHLLWNSLGVIALGIACGLTYEQLRDGLASFPGTKRRFEVSTLDDNIFVDDYAHHPTAIRVTIEAARLRYPDKKIVAVYKPDRYSRVVRFIDDFVSALSLADEICLVPFADNTMKEPGFDIDVSFLANRLPRALVVEETEADAKRMLAFRPAVFIGMSTKDVYKILNNVKRYQKS